MANTTKMLTTQEQIKRPLKTCSSSSIHLQPCLNQHMSFQSDDSSQVNLLSPPFGGQSILDKPSKNKNMSSFHISGYEKMRLVIKLNNVWYKHKY